MCRNQLKALKCGMYGCVESKILYTNGPAKYEMPLLRRMCATISWAVHLPDIGKCKLLHVTDWPEHIKTIT